MDVKTAARLYDLRRKKGLSQEELADALGVTRQAVSKWERAESSPDTDNLISLARLYGVSLDELVGLSEADGEEKEEKAKEEKPEDKEKGGGFSFEVNDGDDRVDIKLGDIDISGGKGRVKIDRDGIFIHGDDGKKVIVGKDGISINGEEKVCLKKGHIHIKRYKGKGAFPLSAVYLFCSVIAYILMGSLADLWHPGWLVFVLIPVVGGLESAIRTKNANVFPYPVFCAAAYLAMGFIWGLWHPGWVIFITIPVFYTLANAFKSRKAAVTIEHKEDGEEDE